MAPTSDNAGTHGADPDRAPGAGVPEVGMLREGIDAYNRGDLGWLYEHASDEIQVRTARDLANYADFTGKDRFRVWMEQWLEAWSESTIEIVSVEAVGDRFILAEVTQTSIGASSGIETAMEMVQLIELSAGEIERFHLYANLEQARAAMRELGATE
jgi:ketosteroid isomerase-like protein